MCREAIKALATVLAVAGSLLLGASRAAGEEGASGRAAEEADTKVLSFLKQLEIIGGISAGWFYASNPGHDASDNEALLSNCLFGLTSADQTGPVSFEAAIGETSTPSLLSPPEVNRDFQIEFASVTLRPFSDAEVSAGLLEPVAGYEATYTYENHNIVSGIVAAQQPYNAYGARAKYAVAGLELSAAYYSERLDEGEYAVDRDGDGEDDRMAGRSWEIDLGGELGGLSFLAYHYHLEGLRNGTGAVAEYTFGNVYLALNADYWKWDASLSDFYERDHAMGAALYIVPSFGSFSLPVRLEYVDQGGSRIYVDNPDTKTLWSATITPTYRWTEKAYLRAEASYVHGKDAFADDDGDPKSNRVYLAGEVGYLF